METPTLDSNATAQAPAWAYRPFRTAAVVGAGVMGSQIAAHLANAGLEVLLLDVTPESIGREGKKNDLVEGAFKAATKMKPAPFMTPAAQKRITLGNFDDDFDKIGDAEWVIEVVIERMDIKKDVLARIEKAASDTAVISSNTSGLPIAEMSEDLGDGFKARFLGTHFFNPPRYLKLFEVIPTPDTDPEVVARVTAFARVHLGKGIVMAKDTPNFIGNRIGTYAMLGAVEQYEKNGYSIEEIDALTGTLIGHAKSATFRTADVVGLDTLRHVTANLYEAIPDDESRDRFQVPDVLQRLVDLKHLGAKSKAGFYKKEGKAIKSFNAVTGEYEDAAELGFDPKSFRGGSLAETLRNLWADTGRAGQFFRDTTLDLIGYTARRTPEISDSPANLDRALQWGFGWEMGPYQMWDALGIDAVRDALDDAEIPVPAWVADVPVQGFYRDTESGVPEVWTPGTGRYQSDPRPADEWGLTYLKEDANNTLWENSDAALLDVGDGVALFEFRSKSNSLGSEVITGVMEAIQKVEDDRDLRGMIIGNEGSNFSVGANLGEVAMALMMGEVSDLEPFIATFQEAVFKIRYATKPVVVTTHQRVLGGGCEMTMACPHPVLAAETYIGLVELGVGLIPAGGGTTMMAARAAELAADQDRPSEIQPFLRQHFETIAMANVATSAFEARDKNFIDDNAIIVMNDARRFHVAKAEVTRLSEQGYRPPAVRSAIPVLGAPGRAQFEIALHQFEEGGYVSAYDHYLGSRLAWVMTGGDLTAPAEVHEDYLLELEREVFLSLLGEEKTMARIQSILTTNKPLRN
ncbi:3-hydroxyacyl-CoA dehydrogenase/enoyl-CoA hydratase family protein [Rubrivirga sp. IMCC45206]|uniref:3-hydroxyacyl-CoA dehydrogenase/enoyl-CoA hydratase family protein n=1 Tax=Rubrivirga sp. IMCC45206 TaxID=3391614 RepID=UPI0039901E46